jgi:lipid-A-disaccharide synthase
MEVMVVAGEASGDQHAADVVAELRRLNPTLTFFGMGGPRLAGVGVELLYQAEEIAVMGIVEVVPRLPRILAILRGLARAAAQRRPACALLVDAPDFNLRLAARLKGLRIPVVSFVAPTVWAWRSGRTETLRHFVDVLLCILPFEEAFLRGRGVNATYVGNPVLDQIPTRAPPEHFRRLLGLDVDRPVLALLPGSRLGEVRRLLDVMVGAAQRLAMTHPGLQVVVPVAPSIPLEVIGAHFAGTGLSPRLVAGRAPEVVGASDVALVASGTAALEAGLMGRPMVVVYRLAWITYLLARLLVRVPFFCLVNILLQRKAVPELLQSQVTVPRVTAELERVWSGPGREAQVCDLSELPDLFGPAGAATRAADHIFRLISKR